MIWWTRSACTSVDIQTFGMSFAEQRTWARSVASANNRVVPTCIALQALVQVSFAFTNISWFLSRMSCIFCVIKILVFSSMQFSRYTRMRARLKLESCGMLAFLSDYKFKCIGTQCHDRGSYASEVRIQTACIVTRSGLKWTRTTDLTLIRRAL